MIRKNDLQERVELNRRHREWRKKNHDARLERERARHKQLQESNLHYRELKVKNMQRWRDEHREQYLQYQRAYYQKRKEQQQ